MGKECSKADCTFATSGLCLNELGDACHNILPGEADVTETDVPTEICFHSGEKLTPDEASRVLNDIPAQVILCAGTQDAGKTTFLARLGELFRAGSFTNYNFAKSLTLVAFERATWHATITCAGAKADTRRTSRSENDRFLHLQVQSCAMPRTSATLLISDLSGESYRDAIASKAFCSEQQALERADTICLFLDSGTLANKRQRFAEHDNAIHFLRRVLEVVNPRRLPSVCVIFSRWDKLAESPDSQKHIDYCDAITLDFKTKFGHLFSSLSFHRIAARPADGKPTDAELMRLFDQWVAHHIASSSPMTPRYPRPARDFSAFGLP